MILIILVHQDHQLVCLKKKNICDILYQQLKLCFIKKKIIQKYKLFLSIFLLTPKQKKERKVILIQNLRFVFFFDFFHFFLIERRRRMSHGNIIFY